MKYPEWWQRFLAALIDGVIFVIIALIINAVFVAIGGLTLLLVAAIVNTALFVAYKVIFEGSAMQATPGKMCFGLKLVNESGQRVNQQQAFMRTWPWWLNLLTLLSAIAPALGTILSLLVLIASIVIFATFFMDPLGRCIHDQTARCNVIKAGKGMFA